MRKIKRKMMKAKSKGADNILKIEKKKKIRSEKMWTRCEKRIFNTKCYTVALTAFIGNVHIYKKCMQWFVRYLNK